MKRFVLLMAILAAALQSASCQPGAPTDPAPRPTATDPAAAPNQSEASTKSSELLAANFGEALIFRAEYVGTTGTSRTSARLVGRNFKTQLPNESDCLESPDGSSWSPCAKMIYASATEYDVILSHSAAYPQVFVKVRGPIGLYSTPVLVRK
jgi:hypothetical protein